MKGSNQRLVVTLAALTLKYQSKTDTLDHFVILSTLRRTSLTKTKNHKQDSNQLNAKESLASS